MSLPTASRRPRRGPVLACTALLTATLIATLNAQDLEDDRNRGVRMLREIRRELGIWYYDPAFGGRSLDELFGVAEQRVRAARSQAEISGHIAGTLLSLDDSHTFFIPPPQPSRVEYGFDLRMIGERCLVTAVKPGSLAHADGLRPGMIVQAVEGVTPTRSTLWKIRYSLNALRPRKEVTLTLRTTGEAVETLAFRSEMTPPRQYQRFEDWADELRLRRMTSTQSTLRVKDVGADVLAIRLASFGVSDRQIDDAMKQARGRKGLVLDLRDNPGGLVAALTRLAGYFFAEPTKLGELHQRKKVHTLTSQKRPADQVFGGQVVVLVDSGSASAAESLPRILQIAGRARVVGDRSAGAVMVSMSHGYQDGHEGRFLVYGLSITDAVFRMNDGQSLEKQGVTPDEILLPTPEDLAQGRDPVLARAIAMVGGTIDPAAAGALFPIKWR